MNVNWHKRAYAMISKAHENPARGRQDGEVVAEHPALPPRPNQCRYGHDKSKAWATKTTIKGKVYHSTRCPKCAVLAVQRYRARKQRMAA